MSAQLTMYCAALAARRQTLPDATAGRLELSNPYRPTGVQTGAPAWTPAELDMRRKTEILQYKTNVAGQLPAATQNQNWRNLVTQSRAAQRRATGYDPTTGVSVNCDTLPTTTDRSGVPGPIITLTMNPNAPLYNFAPIMATRTYTNTGNQNAPNG